MKALFLYSHLPAYFYNCLKELIAQGDIRDILVIASFYDKDAPHILDKSSNIQLFSEPDLSYEKLEELSLGFSPDIVYISGWDNRIFKKMGRHFCAREIPVIMGMDNQWRGTLRQIIAILLSKWSVRRHASHAWVAGSYQYEFARMLGFRRSNVLFNLYTADTDLFSTNIQSELAKKKIFYPKEILFVGRFVEVKNVIMLADVFLEINEHLKEKWTLRLVGNGPLRQNIPNNPYIIIEDFRQQHELVKIMQNSGVFCLPSTHENWGVVIHEAVASGLPVVASDDCGAAVTFVKNNFNGYQFKSGDRAALYKALYKIISQSDAQLFKMAENSAHISTVITPKLWAASFTSLIRK